MQLFAIQVTKPTKQDTSKPDWSKARVGTIMSTMSSDYNARSIDPFVCS